MKLVSITPFDTTAGTAKKTEISLNTKPGVFFQIVTPSYTSLYFDVNTVKVPVQMVHNDRDENSVSITVENNTAIIEQGYQMSAYGFLFEWVNDDWTDVDELSATFINTLQIRFVVLTNGTQVAVTSKYNSNNVLLRSTDYTPGAANIPVKSVITANGREYTYPALATAHKYQDDPVKYDYFTMNLSAVISAYTEQV